MKYCCTSALKGLAILIFALVLTGDLCAQVSSLSPYSRFGIGTILAQGTSVNHGLGGSNTGFVDHFSINLENPASYSYLYNTTFNLGARGTMLTLSDENDSEKLNFASINNFAFVFKRQGGKFAASLGLVPYTTTGYSITDNQTLDEIGDVAFTYDGEGGINRANAGAAYRIDLKNNKGLLDKNLIPDSGVVRHNISFGANMNYYFGSLNQSRRVLFSNPEFIHTRISTSTAIKDVNVTVGVLSLFNLKNKFVGSKRINKIDLMFGASYEIGSDFNTRFEELTETVLFFNNTEVIVDTVLWVQESDGVISIPEKLAFGGGLRISNKGDRTMKFVVDYKEQDWSKFSGQFGTATDENLLSTATSISAGFEFTPKSLGKATRTGQRSSYRLGARQSASYLVLADHQITEQAISAGISVPMMKSQTFPPSKLNLGIEIGNRGTTEVNLIEESFVNFYVGFSLTPHVINKWFVQRKYD